jgi:hypothetical protein
MRRLWIVTIAVGVAMLSVAAGLVTVPWWRRHGAALSSAISDQGWLALVLAAVGATTLLVGIRGRRIPTPLVLADFV